MKKIFFIILLVLSHLAFADCENINLVTEKNSPFNEIPVYDQDGLGSCYAYAAAQLMDYVRFKKDLRVSGNINPVWLALNYAQNESKSSLESGGITKAINYAKDNGICDGRVVRKALDKYKKNNKISDAELADLIETVYDVWSKPENKYLTDVYKDATKTCYAGRRITDSLFNSIFDTFKRPDGLYSKVIPSILLDELLKMCNKENTFNPDVGFAYDVCDNCNDKDIAKVINNVLSSKKPIGISYCSQILHNKNYRGIDSSRNDIFRFNNRSSRIISRSDISKKKGVFKGCGSHASIIAGSRSVGGKCQYLLRNSWGSTSYKDHPNCLCKTSAGKFIDCKHGDGKPNKVGCWIDEADLTSNIYRLNYLGNKK